MENHLGPNRGAGIPADRLEMVTGDVVVEMPH